MKIYQILFPIGQKFTEECLQEQSDAWLPPSHKKTFFFNQKAFRYFKPFLWPGPIAKILQNLMSFYSNRETREKSRLLNNHGVFVWWSALHLRQTKTSLNVPKYTSFINELLVFLYLEYYVCFIYWMFTFWEGTHFCLLKNLVFVICCS